MRNTLCPRYGKCLALTARRDRQFDCARCRWRKSAPADFERRLSLWHDLDGARLLLAAIFHPGLYSAYLQLRNRGDDAAGAAVAVRAENDAGDCVREGEIVEPGASGEVGLNPLDSFS